MVTTCAPAYLSSSETILKENIKCIYPRLNGLFLSYLRFIGNIFFTWTGSDDQLITLLNDLNTKYNSAKFEYKISQASVPFLETEVYTKNYKQYTKLYRKETDRWNFLHINSEHPVPLKNSIPYNQVLIVKRTCSTIENLKLYCSEIKQKFIEKRYKSDLLGKSISTVEKLNQNEKLKERVREKPKSACILLTITYIKWFENIGTY